MKVLCLPKAVLYVLIVLLLASSVAAWGASRSITGNTVTITIDASGSNALGEFTIRETLTGATVVTPTPAGCILFRPAAGGDVLTCDYTDVTLGTGTIVYSTSGSGSVAGTITGRDAGAASSREQAITGDTAIPSAVACTDDCSPNGATVCAGGGQLTCGKNYDADACLEWSSPTECPRVSTTCPDGFVASCLPSCSAGSCGTCTPDCTGHGASSVCGDGVIGGTEICDDGNTKVRDGCSDVCVIEVGYLCSGAGATSCNQIGDVTMDGIISIPDVREVLKRAVGLILLTEQQGALADVTCDGVVNTKDAIQIMAKVANLRPAFTACPIKV